MDFEPIVLIGAFLLALFVGGLTGIFGVGGGFLMTPCLVIFLKVPSAVAVGTDLLVILATSSVGLLRRLGTRTVDHKLAVISSVGSVVGVLIGQQLLQYLKVLPPIRLAGKEQNALEYILLWMFLIFLCWVVGLLYFDYRRSRETGAIPHERFPLFSRIPIGPRVKFSTVEAGALSLPALLALGGGIGVLIGLLGVGGGVLWLPALFYLVGQRTSAAAGTSLMIVWISAMVGSSLNVSHGNVDWRLCGVMLAGGVLGSWYGTHVGLRLAGARMKYYFIYVVLAAVTIVAVRVGSMTLGR
jgi:uncharacterized membrane protein YfcA